MSTTTNRGRSDPRHAVDRRAYLTLWLSPVGCLITLALGILVTPLAAEAPPQAKLPRISLWRFSSPPDPFAEAFREGPRELRYQEGKRITLEYRYAEGKPERLPHLAHDRVRLRVDVIVQGGTAATSAAQKTTSTIPIVMPSDIDPVVAG